jgi:phage gp36-like protein
MAMHYCTAADIANTATGGWEELAQRASPTQAGVSGALLAAAANGDDISDQPASVQELANAAALRVAWAIEMSSKHIDTYLYTRYREFMPLAPEVIVASSLPACCAAIALKRLWGASMPRDMADQLKWADQYLVDISKGVVSLGQAEAQAPVSQPPGAVHVRTKPSAFDWGQY